MAGLFGNDDRSPRDLSPNRPGKMHAVPNGTCTTLAQATKTLLVVRPWVSHLETPGLNHKVTMWIISMIVPGNRASVCPLRPSECVSAAQHEILLGLLIPAEATCRNCNRLSLEDCWATARSLLQDN